MDGRENLSSLNCFSKGLGLVGNGKENQNYKVLFRDAYGAGFRFGTEWRDGSPY